MGYTGPSVHHFREVRTTGNSLNAGCFINNDLEGWSSVGVDRSQADAPYMVSGVSGFTATTVAGSGWGYQKSLTITGHTVSSDDIGNFVLVSSTPESDIHTGLFCIDNINVVGSNTWHMTQIIRENTLGSSTYEVTCRMGGAWPNLGFMETVDGRNDWECSATYIKSGTYALTTTSANTDGGPFQKGEWNTPCVVVGYYSSRNDKGAGGRPLLTVGSTGYTGTMLSFRGYRSSAFENIEIDGDGTATIGCRGYGYPTGRFVNCKVTNLNTSSGKAFEGDGVCLSCEASGGGKYGFYEIGAARCVAHGVDQGFFNSKNNVTSSLAYDVTTGFSSPNNYVQGTGNTADDCTTGFSYAGILANCLASNCTTGFDWLAAGAGLIGCGVYNNTTNVDADNATNLNPIVCSSDPYEDQSARDYRLNSSATGGALLAGEGYSIPGQTDYRDVGGVLTEPSGGGSSVIPARPIQIGA